MPRRCDLPHCLLRRGRELRRRGAQLPAEVVGGRSPWLRRLPGKAKLPRVAVSMGRERTGFLKPRIRNYPFNLMPRRRQGVILPARLVLDVKGQRRLASGAAVAVPPPA